MPRSTRSVDGVTGRLYVVGEQGERRTAVKIGVTIRGTPSTVAKGLQRGNPRRLEVLHDEIVPYRDLRWREWRIHMHLLPWHVRGEWFDVGSKARKYPSWKKFLHAAFVASLPGSQRWRLGTRPHHLASMHRITMGEPRRFDAVCNCGHVEVGPLGKGLQSVQVQFATEHLCLSPRDPIVKALRRNALIERQMSDGSEE